MTLYVDLGAMSANAAHAKAIAKAAKWPICAVIKDSYARAPIVRAILDGGISDLALSSLRAAEGEALVGAPRERLTMINLPLPSDASRILVTFASTTHSSLATVQAFAKS